MTISTKNVGSVDGNIQKQGKKEKSNPKDVFADLMNLTSVADVKTDSTAKSDLQNKKIEFASPVKTSGKENSFVDNTSKNTNANEKVTAKDDKTNKYQQADTKKVSDDNVKEDTALEEYDDDTLKKAKKAVSSMIDKLFAVISEQFDVSIEDINNGLSGMNIDVTGLFDENTLKDFLLFLNGADNVSLLVDEKLSDAILDMKELISDLSDDMLDTLSDLGIDADGEGLDTFLQKLLSAKQNDIASKGELTEVFADDEAILDENFIVNVKKDDVSKESASENKQDLSENISYEASNRQEDAVKNVNEQSSKETFDFSNESFNDRQEIRDDSVNINFAQAVGEAFNNSEVSSVQGSFDVNGADIVRQIIDDIKAYATKETTSIVVHLSPENLGRVTITVSEKEGIMQARIIAENEAAKNAIENGIANLKEAFENQELKVDAIEVMVATHEFLGQQTEGNFEENNSSGASNGQNIANGPNDIADEEEVSDEELLEAEMMRMTGNSVSYSV